ncbi:hypothetical protein ACLOJK_005159 [Asimina triloba]
MPIEAREDDIWSAMGRMLSSLQCAAIYDDLWSRRIRHHLVVADQLDDSDRPNGCSPMGDTAVAAVGIARITSLSAHGCRIWKEWTPPSFRWVPIVGSSLLRKIAGRQSLVELMYL